MVTSLTLSALAGTERAFERVRDVETQLEEIEQMLEEEVLSTGDSDSGGTDTESEEHSSVTPSVAARRIMLQPNQQVNVESVISLNRIYAAESAVLAAVQEYFISSMLKEKTIERGVEPTRTTQSLRSDHINAHRASIAEFSEEESIITYQGVSAAVSSKIDIFTITYNLTQTSVVHFRLGRPLLLDHYLMLEDVLSVSRMPNRMEVYMLSRALRLPMDTVKTFFYLKRAQLHKYYGSHWTLKQKLDTLRAECEKDRDRIAEGAAETVKRPGAPSARH